MKTTKILSQKKAFLETRITLCDSGLFSYLEFTQLGFLPLLGV
jgi:hypothetical protein